MESCGGHDSDSTSTFTSEKGLEQVVCDLGDGAADQELDDDRKGSRRAAGKRTVKQALRQQAKRRRKNTSVAAGALGPTPRLQAHCDIDEVKDEVEVEGGVRYRQPTMAEVLASIPGWRGRVAARGRARVRRLSAAAQLAQTERERCVDLETPDSVLVTANLRQLLNKHTFSSLPPLYQYKLLQLLPRVDRAPAPHSAYLYRLSSLGLNNEFFARACMDWRERLAEGEFTPENQAKLKAEHDREKAKLDPWKLKHFEPMWGETLEEWPALGSAGTVNSPPAGTGVAAPTTPAATAPVKKKRAATPASKVPTQPRTPSRPLRTVGAVTRSLRQAAAIAPTAGEDLPKDDVLKEDVPQDTVEPKEEPEEPQEQPPLLEKEVIQSEVPFQPVKIEEEESAVDGNITESSAETVSDSNKLNEVEAEKIETNVEASVLPDNTSILALSDTEEMTPRNITVDVHNADRVTIESSPVLSVAEVLIESEIPSSKEEPVLQSDSLNIMEPIVQPPVEVEQVPLIDPEKSAECSLNMFVGDESQETEILSQEIEEDQHLDTVNDLPIREPVEEPALVEIEVEGYSTNAVGPVVESIVTVDGTSYSIATSVAPGDPSGEQVVTTVSCVAVERKDSASAAEVSPELNQSALSLTDSVPSPSAQADQLSSSWEVIKVDPDSAQSKDSVVDEEAILAAAWKAVSSHQLDHFTPNAPPIDEVSVIACQEELEVTLEETNRGCTDIAPSMGGGNTNGGRGSVVAGAGWTPLPSAATLRPAGPSSQAGHVKLELEVTLTPESQVSSSSGTSGISGSLPPVVAPPTLVCLSRRPPTPAPTPPPVAPPASALPCLSLTTSTPVRAVASPRPRPRPAPRPNRPPPGAVNLERSYQICQAVIDNSPNRDQLQGQLRRPPGTVPARPRAPSAQPQPLLIRRVFTSHAGVPVNMALLPNSSPSAAAQVRYSGIRRSNSAPPGGGAAGVVRASSGTTATATRPASVGLALARAPRDCACSLQPLRPCAKCGAFCHQDCISPSSLCIACHTN